MSFRRSNISRIGGMLKSTLQDLGIQERVLEQKAIAQWKGVVGPQIAASTTPESVRDGILFVCCKSSMWSSELSLHKDDIVKRLNAAVGKPVVKDIRFSARGFRKSSGESERTTEPEPSVPISPEEVKAAEEVAAACSSEELAEKVRRAILTSKQRRTEE